MYPKLLHIYGPLYINSYGVAIALGLALLMWFISKDSIAKRYLSIHQLHTILLLGIISGIVGGRSLYVINNWYELTSWYDIMAVWSGGLSILGTVVGVLASTFGYLWLHKIPILSTIDRFVIYVPLAQAMGRLGCFVAGCCHGTVTSMPWAVTYTSADSFAPRYLSLHPAQLYSAALLLIIFFILQFLGHKKQPIPGQLTAVYLLLIGAERFIIDFWRGDRMFFAANMLNLSVHQWLSGGIVIGVIALYALRTLRYNSLRESLRERGIETHRIKIKD